MLFLNLVYNDKYKIKLLFLEFIRLNSLELKIKLTLIETRSLSMIYDSQVYTALCISLLAGILAIRLGSTLYE